MTLLKSLALQLIEDELELQRIEAEKAQEVVRQWTSKLPVIAPTVNAPASKARSEDTRPFGYDYSHLPSRSASRQKRWSEL